MIRVIHIKADASLARNTFHINGDVQAGDGEVLMVQLQQFCLSPDARSNIQTILGNDKNLNLMSSLSSVSLESNTDNNIVSSRILGVFYRATTFNNLYAGSQAPFTPISQRHLDRIEFWLEDDSGTRIAVPGNFSLSLVVKSVRA